MKTKKRTVLPTESQEQCALIEWWDTVCSRFNLPPSALAAIPNGGLRSKITGARLKKEGVRAGYPDLFLSVARRSGEAVAYGLFIEMKRCDCRRDNKGQLAMHTEIRSRGYRVVVSRGWDEARMMIEFYLGGAPRMATADEFIQKLT